MPHLKKNISLSAIITTSVTAVFILGLPFVIAYGAWTDPTQAPPLGNIAAPLNTSPLGQAKAGGLLLNAGGGATDGLIVEKDATVFNGDLFFDEISPGGPAGSHGGGLWWIKDGTKTNTRGLGIVSVPGGPVSLGLIEQGIPRLTVETDGIHMDASVIGNAEIAALKVGVNANPPPPAECTKTLIENDHGKIFAQTNGNVWMCLIINPLGGPGEWRLISSAQKLCGYSVSDSGGSIVTGPIWMPVPNGWTRTMCQNMGGYFISCLHNGGMSPPAGIFSTVTPNCGW